MTYSYGVIYKATNLINDKIYIGQTIQEINIRIDRHFRDASNGGKTVFCRAIRRYGRENFKWQIIDSAKNSEELSEKEFYWIEHLNSYVNSENSNGYNMRLKGKGLEQELNPNSKLSKESIVEMIQLAKSGDYTIPMIAKEFNVARQTINRIFNLGTGWNSLIKEFITLDELALLMESLRESTKNITSKIMSDYKSKENHHNWGRKGADNPKSRPVLQIDLKTNEVIAEFPSATVASKFVNAYDSSKIAMVCRGERKMAFGYKWAFKDNFNSN